jgi:hypothetical protein
VFRRDLPYELGAGGHVVLDDGSAHGARFHRAFACFTDCRFERVGELLGPALDANLPTIAGWDERSLGAR